MGTSAEKPAEEMTESAMEEVTGHVMESLDRESAMPSVSGMPLRGILLVLLMLIVIGVGFWRKK